MTTKRQAIRKKKQSAREAAGRCQETSISKVNLILFNRLKEANVVIPAKYKAGSMTIRTVAANKKFVQLCNLNGISTYTDREEVRCANCNFMYDGMNFGICETHLRWRLQGRSATEKTKFDAVQMIKDRMVDWKRQFLNLVDPALRTTLNIMHGENENAAIKAATFVLEHTEGLLPNLHAPGKTQVNIQQNINTAPEADLLSEEALGVLTDSEKETFLVLLAKVRDAVKLQLPAGPTQEVEVAS